MGCAPRATSLQVAETRSYFHLNFVAVVGVFIILLRAYSSSVWIPLTEALDMCTQDDDNPFPPRRSKIK